VRFLAKERAVLDRYLPGLDSWLASAAHEDLESPRGLAIGQFREQGGGNLMLSRRFGGSGATFGDALHVQRAIGSRAPSLAVATTMHHYKVTMLERFMPTAKRDELLCRVGRERMLIASCSGEGRVGANLFRPSVTACDVDGGLVVSGSKKPCCLIWSAGLLSVFLTAETASRYRGQQLNVLISADAPGIERRPFWSNPVLAGSESDELRLHAVFVPDHHVLEVGQHGDMTDLMTYTLTGFELLACGAYVGIASGLVERVLQKQAGDEGERAGLAGELEAVMAALERVADVFEAGESGPDVLGRSLFVRYAAQAAIARVTDVALELLGGMSFISRPSSAYAAAASRALAFHPPAEVAMRSRLVHYLEGGPLTLP
jgi:alkylation response protein AidB-like acyl-CoA dehydrogenase